MMRGCLAGVLAVLVVAAAIVIIKETHHNAPIEYLGDADRGRALFAAYGCPSCHTTGMVGPPLDDVGTRSYIAGRFPNIRGVMIQWLQHPQSMKPGTAMPELGVTRRDADDIATYLATLR